MIIELRTDLHVTVKNLIDSSNGEAAAITAANGAGINRFMRCNDIADDNLQDEVMDYFRSNQQDDLDAAVNEFSSDFSKEDVQLLRLHFISEFAF